MVTMKDVAKLAGVSHGTVSNIINGDKNVSLDKIRRVENAMKTLGYRPNKFARSLKTNRTMHVDVIFPNIIDFSLAQLFSSIATSARNKGYNVSLYVTNENSELEKEYLNNAIMSQTDGIILITCQPRKKAFFEDIIKACKKIVFLQRMVDGLDANFLCFNADTQIEQFIKSKYQMGIENLVLFSGSNNFTFERNCINKFISMGKAYYGQDFNDNIVQTNSNKESALKMAVPILESLKVKTAILTTSQLITDGVYKAVELLNIPKNLIDVTTFDAMTWAQNDQGDIKKIGLPFINLGEEAFEMLYDDLQSPVFSESKKRYLDVELSENPFRKPKPIYKRVSQGEKLKVLMLESSAAKATKILLREFEKNTGISAEITTCTYEKLYESILLGYEQNSFDVFEVDLPWIPSLVAANVLEDIERCDPNYKKYLGDIIKQIIPDYTQYRGRTYAFPYMFCSQLLFYRTDLFEDITNKKMFLDMYKTELRPPRTWSEFNAVARFFTREYNPDSKSIYGTTLGGQDYNGAVCEFLPRLWSYGGEIIKNGVVCIDSEEAVKALNNYKESFLYASPNSKDNWWNEQCSEFSNGKAAMMMLFDAHATDIVDRAKSKVIGKVNFEAIPGNISLIGGWSLGISSKSKHKDDALQLLKWTCSEKTSVINTILGGSSPCIKVYNDLEIATIYPWHRKTVDVYEFAKKRNLPDLSSGEIIPFKRFEQVLGNAVHRAICNEIDSKVALKEVAEFLKKFYET